MGFGVELVILLVRRVVHEEVALMGIPADHEKAHQDHHSRQSEDELRRVVEAVDVTFESEHESQLRSARETGTPACNVQTQGGLVADHCSQVAGQ